MGNYSLRNLFNKEPIVIASAIRAILFVLVLFGLAIDEKQLAGIALALELVLGLFTRAQTTPVAAPTVPEGTEITVQTAATEPDRTVTV